MSDALLLAAALGSAVAMTVAMRTLKMIGHGSVRLAKHKSYLEQLGINYEDFAKVK